MTKLQKNIKKYLKVDLNKKNKRRAMNIGYAGLIGFAFIMSLVNNSNVNASVSPHDVFDYTALENVLDESNAHISVGGNVKALVDAFNLSEREKLVTKEVEVSKGDTFSGMLTKAGMDYVEANGIVVKLKKVFDVRSLRIGQKITISTLINPREDNKIISFESIIINKRADERVIIEKDESGEYNARVEKDELVAEVNSAAGGIEGNLSVAMTDKNVPNKTITEFINIFGFSVDFRRDVRKGDKFEIIYENYINADGNIIKTGNILYASLTLRKDKIALYRFEDSKGKVDYFNEKGLAMKKTLSRKPMAFQKARISSPFGKRRHPIYKDVRVHWGVDYAAPKGSAIYAGGDGVVTDAKWHGGYGKYVKIRHNSEYSTAYGHMNGFAKGIAPGVRVKQGQLIGYVGNTGKSTGPHLHYEVIKAGRRVNPLTIKASTGENLSGANMEKFKAVMDDIRTTYQAFFEQNGEEKVAQAEAQQ